MACATRTDDAGKFCPSCGAVLVEDASLHDQAPDPGDSANTSTPASSLIGMTIDGFVIEDILGGGAFGTVFKARQVGLDRPVAIKVPTHEIAFDPVMARRFAREARSAARITHPGVVAIYAVGELPDRRPYLAMQLIDGEPLNKILVDGPIPVVRALRIVRDVASALSETHAADVVHRDLKPSNIMWRRDRNGDDRITLVDFGIAIANPGTADATRLTTNGLIDTPHYMSPEQAHGELADSRADLYGLGCILFELITGKPPFDGSGFEVLLAHLGRPIPLPSDRNPDVPEVVDRLVTHLLAKKPEDRPQTANDLVALIDAAISQLEGRAASDSASATRRQAKKRQSARQTARKTAQATAEARRCPGSVSESRPLHSGPGSGSESRPLHSGARPRRTSRWIVLGIAGVLVLTAAGFAAIKLSRSSRSTATLAGTEGTSTTIPIPAATEDEAPSPFTGRRVVVADDGEMTARATLYDPIVAGTRAYARLELWNAIGAPLDAPQLVITIEDPSGNASGTTALRSKRAAGRFGFWHVFPTTGHFKLRVFPPEAASVFTIDVDVE